MTKRKVLAVATLTALPLFTGTVHSGITLGHTGGQMAHTLQVADQTVGPQWAYAFGMEGGEALMFGASSAIACSFFGIAGGIACGVTGAL